MKHVNRWGVFEETVKGPKEGNLFTEQVVTGEFTSENESVKVSGFYDG